MEILITGALGHIGSQLIRRLPELVPNVKLVLLDNLATQRYASLFHLPTTNNYEFIEADVLQVDLKPLIKNANVVIHLAALTDATNSYNDPEHIYKHNFTATIRVAEVCAMYHTPLFFPSSTSVYGPTELTVIDDSDPNVGLQPQSPYAACKLKEEQALLTLHREQQLPLVICRLGTIFGTSPGMRFHTAVSKFCWQATMGQPVTIWKTAYQQKRPYLCLEDAIRAIGFILKHNLFHGEIYNVVTSNHTVEEVITNIQHKVPDLQVQFIKNKIMNDFSFEVINKKLTEKGFNCVGILQHGINETLELIQGMNKVTTEK
jgi:nucleoside-diphosphate-sugar epimerase